MTPEIVRSLPSPHRRVINNLENREGDMAITMIESKTVNGKARRKGDFIVDAGQSVERKMVDRGFAEYGDNRESIKSSGKKAK